MPISCVDRIIHLPDFNVKQNMLKHLLHVIHIHVFYNVYNLVTSGTQCHADCRLPLSVVSVCRFDC